MTSPAGGEPARDAHALDRALRQAVGGLAGRAGERLAWLRAAAPDAFGVALRHDAAALVDLALGLDRLGQDRELTLRDRGPELLVARLDQPGSIFGTLQRWPDREVVSAEIVHSSEPVPGAGAPLELQRYRFAREAEGAGEAGPAARAALRPALEVLQPALSAREAARALERLWAHDPAWARLAPPGEVAAMAGLLHRCLVRGGVLVELGHAGGDPPEAQVLFGVVDPPRRGFLTQVMEVFNALDLGVKRCTSFTVEADGRPVFLGSFQVAHRRGLALHRDAELFQRLRRQLHATQLVSTESATYRELVLDGRLTSEEAALVDALIGFCHTSLAHHQPDTYTFEDVIRAFHTDLEMTLRLARLFRLRFDPDAADREAAWPAQLAAVERDVEAYATGHRMLDEFRRSIFRTALLFVRHTLKTNFFVDEKHALAFRLHPAYLEALGPQFTADLPPGRPFRVTFFFARGALGYHVGFSDIARGGWRTVLTQTRDDYVTVANTVFRETYVLAHTQHLKNKDIYEGGSKMVVVVRALGAEDREAQRRRLHQVQRAVASAFLDVFVTRDGRAASPRVVDHYGEDEPIELGPDENMHDEMIEAVASLSVRRGYVLGAGVMSSKRVGINHKQYGVTSTGVFAFAEIAMRARGLEVRRDPFSLKLTGGPNGDVAGNLLRLVLERCPRAQVRLVVDGSAALWDPAGLDHEALRAVVLRADADAFDPERLSPGGVLLSRTARRTEGLRALFRRLERTAEGLRESWVTVDEFHREYDGRIFDVPADLFVPAGGRPETVDETNWRRLLGPDGRPHTPVVVEGANSFFTPGARAALQQAGVVLLRDAAANKCGVISSSYEIIANLLLSEREFLARKEAYVRDVLAILERRAADEANLIVRRHREAGGQRTFTEISDALAVEINAHKARLFEWFEAHPGLQARPPYRSALLAHLPRLVRETPAFRARVARLPSKYRSAILAAEIATTMAYRRPLEPDFGRALHDYLQAMFAPPPTPASADAGTAAPQGETT